MLHQAIVDREEQGGSLLPSGLAEKLVRRIGRTSAKTEPVTVTVLMSDIRSYSAIAGPPTRPSWPGSSIPTVPR